MTIAEPSDEVKELIDWGALSDLADEAYALATSGRMTPAAYEDLWKRGLEATANHPEFLESIERWKPPGA